MNLWRKVATLAALAFLGAGIAAAQVSEFSHITGTVFDYDGKPWPDVTVTFKNQQTGGTAVTTKTDKKGNYQVYGVRDGIYVISFDKDTVHGETTTQIGAASDEKGVVTVAPREQKNVNYNFKEERAKNINPEELKKQEEAKQKFQNMKAHFDAGRAALDQADQIHSELAKAPADQRAALAQKMTELSQTAVGEFQQAQQAAQEKDPNLHMVMGNLGAAYEMEGKYDESAAAFQKAAELKPTEANYFLGAGTNLAHAGKMQEAGAACDKFAALQPTNAAACWRNIGAILYNANKLQEAVEPLRKATQIDPKNAETWYLLAAALINTMGSKMEKGKLVAIIAPGTAEAYQKYLELAPNGPHAADAQAALDTLKSLGAGVDATVSSKKKK